MLRNSEEGTIISAVTKTRNFLKVGSKFYKRRKIIPDGKNIKGKGHELRKVQNMCKEWESRLVYVKLTLLHLRNSNSELDRITGKLKLERNLQIKLLKPFFSYTTTKAFRSWGICLMAHS